MTPPTDVREAPFAPAWRAPRASRAFDGPAGSEIARITAKVEEGQRITPAEGLFLHEHADLGTLGQLADGVRARKHPGDVVTYIVDRNINPTNVCITDCGFCAFYRRPGDKEAYVLPREELFAKIQETVDLGGQQLLMQG
jgi:cyclic dehypoxanthinyl futalosine synthase